MTNYGLPHRQSPFSSWQIPAEFLRGRTARAVDNSYILADLLRGGLPRHCRRGTAPDAVQYSDDQGLPGGVDDVHRSAGIAFLADGAVAHGEPAVVDRLHRSAAFGGDDAEMTDVFAGRYDQARVRLEHASAGQDVVRGDVASQHNRLIVGDRLVGGHNCAVGGVVAERRQIADDVVVLVGDRSIAVAMSCGERHPQSRVDVAQGAQMAALMNLHPGEDEHGVGGGHHRKTGGNYPGGNRRGERADCRTAHPRLRSVGAGAAPAGYQFTDPTLLAVMPESRSVGSAPVPIRGRRAPDRDQGIVSTCPGWIRSGLEMPLASAMIWYLLPSP